jgi:hypothetical protein
MWRQSIRGLLDVAPAMDVEFTGFTMRWFGIGFVWMRSKSPKEDAPKHLDWEMRR